MKFVIVTIIFVGGLLLVYINLKINLKIVLNLYNATIISNIILFKIRLQIIRYMDYKFLLRMYFSKGRVDLKPSRKKHFKFLKIYRYLKKIFRINNFTLYEECVYNNRSLAIEIDIISIFKEKLLSLNKEVILSRR